MLFYCMKSAMAKKVFVSLWGDSIKTTLSGIWPCPWASWNISTSVVSDSSDLHCGSSHTEARLWGFYTDLAAKLNGSMRQPRILIDPTPKEKLAQMAVIKTHFRVNDFLKQCCAKPRLKHQLLCFPNSEGEKIVPGRFLSPYKVNIYSAQCGND